MPDDPQPDGGCEDRGASPWLHRTSRRRCERGRHGDQRPAKVGWDPFPRLVRQLQRSGFRDRFELVTRWAAEPLDLLRELRRLKPTVVHFSGHSGPDVASERHPDPAPRRDVVGEPSHDSAEPRHGLFFQGRDGRPQFVSTEALKQTFGAAGPRSSWSCSTPATAGCKPRRCCHTSVVSWG